MSDLEGFPESFVREIGVQLNREPKIKSKKLVKRTL